MDEDLFQANLEALQKYQPHIAKLFEGTYTPYSRVVGSRVTGNLNIDLGHTTFYQKDAASFADAQVTSYLEKRDQRIELGWRDIPEDNGRVAETVLVKGGAYLAEQGVERQVQALDPDGGYLIVFGLGLGLHLERLIDSLDIRSVIVVERFEEFVYHAMGQVDFKRMLEEIDRRKGTLQFVISDTPQHIANYIFYMMRQNSFGLIDGSYIYSHYDSFVLDESLKYFKERLPVLAANPGFFEDEQTMLRNYIGNTTRHESFVYADKPRAVKNTPVIICGSGPSIDQAVDFVKKHRDSAIVISCGTGLGALLGHGIEPDFHVDIENTPGPVEIVEGLSSKHKLNRISLIASNTVRPELVGRFGQRILFYRDTVSSSKLFGQKYGEVFHAVPTVANTAARIALGLGFRNLHLVGVDLGARDQNQHHGQHSVYLSDPEFLKTHPEHLAATAFPIEVPGNLGGTVHTNQSFLFASIHFSGLVARYKDAIIRNHSDGIRITGTVPCLPESAVIDDDVSRKARDLERLRSELDWAARADLAPVSKVEALGEALEIFYATFEAVLNSVDAENLDLRGLFDDFRDLLDDPFAADVDQCVQKMHVGTMMISYTFLYQTYRRLPESLRAEFFENFRQDLLEGLSVMQQASEQLIADMTEATRKIA